MLLNRLPRRAGFGAAIPDVFARSFFVFAIQSPQSADRIFMATSRWSDDGLVLDMFQVQSRLGKAIEVQSALVSFQACLLVLTCGTWNEP